MSGQASAEEGAEIRVLEGLWHSVLPGVPLKVVMVRRTKPKRPRQALEVFFTTELSLSAEQILCYYRLRWSMEIEIRTAKQSYGRAQERCPGLARIEGINNLRLFLASARLLGNQALQPSIFLVRRSISCPLRAFYRPSPHPHACRFRADNPGETHYRTLRMRPPSTWRVAPVI